MNLLRIDLTLTWLLPFVALIGLGLFQNHYKRLVNHRDDLAVAWLNCAEGHPQRVYIDRDYVDVHCKPIYPKYTPASSSKKRSK